MASRKRNVFKGGPKEKARLSTKEDLRQKLAQKRAELRALEKANPATTGLPSGGLEASLTDDDVKALLRADRMDPVIPNKAPADEILDFTDPGPDAPEPPAAPRATPRPPTRKGLGQRFDDWFEAQLKGQARKAAPGGTVRRTLKRLSKGGKAVRMGALGALPFAVPTILEGAEGLAQDLLDPISRVTRGAGLGQTSQADVVRIQDESEQAMLMESIRQRQIEQMARVNEQRIMQVAPHLASQLLAGRRLPQGAVVLGTGQRTDLFREFAQQMVTDPRLEAQPPETFP